MAVFIYVFVPLVLRTVSAFRVPTKAAAASASFEDKLPLCDASIVAEACVAFESDGSAVSAAQVQAALSATESVVDVLWTRLGFSDSEVSCAEMCEAVVKVLGAEHNLPPVSDVACYTIEDGTIVCDEDVSNVGFMDMLNNASFLEANRPADTDGVEVEEEEALTVDYDDAFFLEHVAHFFRIFPALNSAGEVGTEGVGAYSQQHWQLMSQVGIAQIQRGLRQMSGQLFRTYFGSQSSTEPRRVMNAASNILSSAVSLFPASRCSMCQQGFGAFVCPGCDWCSSPSVNTCRCSADGRGRKVIYYCRVAMDSPQRWAAALAVHEATHHRPASTQDHVYGDRAAQNLARSDPRRAANNADNYMYFMGYTGGGR